MNPEFRSFSYQHAFSAFLLVAGIAGCGALAAWLGQDAGWDLRNYHWYVPYAVIGGRLGFDILPSFMGPTFHNPGIDMPFWLAVHLLGPQGATILLGAVQGLNILPLYLIARRALPALPPVGAALLALAGIFGAMNIGLLGATAGDNLLSLFVLCAIAALLSGPRGLWLAGLVAGAGFGLKPVLAPFIVGLALTVIGCEAFRPGGFRRIAGFALCGIAGTLLTGGWWMAILYMHFGNPLMPYFNDVFASAYVPARTYSDPGFTAGLPWPRIQLPFLAGIVDHVAAEAVFTDIRLPAAYLGAIGLVLAAVFGRLRGAALRLGLVVVLTLMVWSVIFAIYRYVLAFEMLGPLLMAAALMVWIGRRGPALVAATLAVVVILAVTRPPETERVDFAADLTGVEVPPIDDPAHTLVLMAGLTPAAFLIPSFPAEIRFLRFDGYWIEPAETGALYAREIRAALDDAAYRRLILFNPEEEERVVPALASLRPGLTLGACRPVPHRFARAGTNGGRFVLCEIEG
ncbi:hypothetical protein [Zavarzinia aquatilis]|uniref:DUF2029 domain-containing protein n=1 Tax=Zavarzinia aquatilis TaxID=2211142 RepID=A0A317E884_9PROT|nr:hypothetical protein [Zavarzinia aquatilis]PWR21315.1 hypothetical protein DKG74_12785 [Zavarzinia aquatilis]